MSKKPKKPKAPKAKMGRPSDYTPEIGAAICERLADGESLKSICAADDMPCKASVYLWLGKHPEFMDMYTRAREDQADTLADEIVQIADDGKNDTYVTEAGQEVVNHDHIARSRLRVEARKWVAAKLKPKKYGDKVETTVQGPGGGPVENKYTVEFVNAASANKSET